MQNTSTNKPGTFYVVSTPIGNLKDVTIRALEVLRSVDYIVCEDTRVTLKLLNSYEIKKSLLSYHSKSSASVVKKIEDFSLSGRDIALVTDSGTPGVSDPGCKLIHRLLERGVSIVPIPGPSAIHTALAASGVSFSEYTFLGFISPKESRRKKKLEELKKRKSVFVFFESPHRIVRFLEDVLETLGNIKVYVAKEMTKKFEKYYRGKITDTIKMLESDVIKGEYTIVVDNRV